MAISPEVYSRIQNALNRKQPSTFAESILEPLNLPTQTQDTGNEYLTFDDLFSNDREINIPRAPQQPQPQPTLGAQLLNIHQNNIADFDFGDINTLSEKLLARSAQISALANSTGVNIEKPKPEDDYNRLIEDNPAQEALIRSYQKEGRPIQTAKAVLDNANLNKPSIGKSVVSGIYNVVGGLYGAGRMALEGAYWLASQPQNLIAKTFNLDELETNKGKLYQSFPIIKKALDISLPAQQTLDYAQSKSAKQYYEKDMLEYLKSGDYINFGKLLGYQVIENLPQQAVIWGTAIATGNPYIGTAIISGQAAGGKYQTINKDIPEYARFTNALSTGMTEYLTESYLGTVPILKSLMGRDKQLFKIGIKEAIKDYAKNIGKATTEEGFEETVSQFTENIVDILSNNRDANGNLPGLFNGVFDATLIGGVTGGLLGAGGTATSRITTSAEQIKEQSAPEVPPAGVPPVPPDVTPSPTVPLGEPAPTTEPSAYKLGDSDISRKQAIAIIQGADDISDFEGLRVSNDPEIESMLADKYNNLQPPVAPPVEPAPETQPVAPTAEITPEIESAGIHNVPEGIEAMSLADFTDKFIAENPGDVENLSEVELADKIVAEYGKYIDNLPPEVPPAGGGGKSLILPEKQAEQVTEQVMQPAVPEPTPEVTPEVKTKEPSSENKSKINIQDTYSISEYRDKNGNLKYDYVADLGKFKSDIEANKFAEDIKNKKHIGKHSDFENVYLVYFDKESDVINYIKSKKFVKQALSEGKPVPPEVLADYPDLQKTAKQPGPEPVKPEVKAKAESPLTPEPVTKKYKSAEEFVNALRPEDMSSLFRMSLPDKVNIFKSETDISNLEAGLAALNSSRRNYLDAVKKGIYKRNAEYFNLVKLNNELIKSAERYVDDIKEKDTLARGATQNELNNFIEGLKTNYASKIVDRYTFYEKLTSTQVDNLLYKLTDGKKYIPFLQGENFPSKAAFRRYEIRTDAIKNLLARKTGEFPQWNTFESQLADFYNQYPDLKPPAEVLADYPDLQKTAKQPSTETPDAKYIGMQERPDGTKIPLFNITKEGHERNGSTVSAETLQELGLKVPVIPVEETQKGEVQDDYTEGQGEISGEVGKGQEPEQAKPKLRRGGKKALAGGVVQETPEGKVAQKKVLAKLGKKGTILSRNNLPEQLVETIDKLRSDGAKILVRVGKNNEDEYYISGKDAKGRNIAVEGTPDFLRQTLVSEVEKPTGNEQKIVAQNIADKIEDKATDVIEWSKVQSKVAVPAEPQVAVPKPEAEFTPEVKAKSRPKLLRKPVVEENLAIVHNLSVDKLRHAIKMGGLAVPSTAVIDVKKSSFGKFGDITLVASKEKLGVAPKQKYFNADIYSPRYPRVTYRLSKESANELNNILKPYRKDGDSVFYSGITDGLDDITTNDSFKEYARAKTGKDKYSDIKYSEIKKIAGDLLTEIGANEIIFNGYTYAGNRIYLKHDLNTVVKLLTKELQDGEGFNYGVPSIRAKSAIRFSSIREMQNNRDKIVSTEEMKKLKNEVNDEFDKLANKTISYLKYGGGEFGAYERFSEHIKEAIETHNFQKVFGDKSEYYNSGVDVNAIVDFVNKLRNMPTEYFEGKIRRAVGLNEFAGAIIPDNTPQDIIDWLNKSGIKTVKYEKNNDADRKSKIEKFTKRENLTFLRKPESKPAPKRKLVRLTPVERKSYNEWKANIESQAEEINAMLGGVQAEAKSKYQAKLDTSVNAYNTIKGINEFYKSQLGGKDIIVLDAPVEYDGVQYNGRIFISNSATNPINVIFGHELMHEIEKNNPELYAVLKNLFRDELSDSVDAIRNFYKTIGIDMSTLSDEEVLSEALNTFVGENLSDNGFWEKLNTENPSFARKLLDAIKELIRRIGEYFKGKTQNISGFVNNADSVIKMAERVIGEYAEGKVTQDQTQTPEFKKWFGSSKVVDENGKPLVVYHGTNYEFNIFKVPYLGVFFASIKSAARKYAAANRYKSKGIPRVISSYLKINNPLIISNKVITEEIVKKAKYDGYDGIINKNIHDYPDPGVIITNEDKYKRGMELFNKIKGGEVLTREEKRRFIEYGRLAFDQGEDFDVYIVFSPTQIKSATGNIGTFDVTNPDIRFMRKADERLEEKTKELEEKIKPFGTGENLKETHYESTLIREKIKAIEQGHRLGQLDTKEYIKDIQKQIRSYAQEHLPKDSITRGQVTQLLTKIENAKDIDTIKDAFDKIDSIFNTVSDKIMRSKINSLLKKYKPKKVHGIVQGKLTAEEQTALQEIGEIINSDRAEMLAEIESERAEIISQMKADRTDLTDEELNDVIDLTDIKERLKKIDLYSDIKNKTGAELKEIYDEIKSIVEEGKSRRAVIKELWKLKIDNLVEMALNDILPEGKSILPKYEAQAKKLLNKRKWFAEHMSLEYILDAITANKKAKTLRGNMTETLNKMVHKSRNTETAGANRYFDIFDKKLKEIYKKSGLALEHQLNKNSDEKDTGIVVERTDPVTDKTTETELRLSQNQAYKIWQWYQDPRLKSTFDTMGFTPEVMKKITDYIKPEVMAWAKWQLEEFYPEYYKSVNEQFRKHFFMDMPFNPFYSPLYRSYVSAEKFDEQLLQTKNVVATVLNGHLKSRVRNKIAVDTTMDGDSVLARHVVEMEHFKSWDDTIKILRAIFKNKSIIAAIEQYHGRNAYQIIDRFINDLARGGIDRSLTIKMADRLRAHYVRAVLASPVIMLKQMTAIPAFALDIPVAQFGKGLTSFLANPVRAIRTLSASDYIKARYGIGWERDIISALHKTTAKKMTGRTKISDLMMIFPKYGDKISVMVGGWTVYNYHYDKAIKAGLSHDIAKEKAMTEFELSVGRTQQAGNVQDLGQIQRGGSFAKWMTMFITAQNAYFRQEYTAARNIARGRAGLADNLRRIAIAHFLLPMIFQFVASGFRWEKKKQIRAMVLGSLNGILVVGDILESLTESLFEGAKYTDNVGQIPALSPFSDIGRSFGALNKMIANDELTTDDWNETLKTIVSNYQFRKNFLSGTSKIIGIPYDTMRRYYEAYEDIANEKTKYPVRRAFGYSRYMMGESQLGRKKTLKKVLPYSNATASERLKRLKKRK